MWQGKRKYLQTRIHARWRDFLRKSCKTLQLIFDQGGFPVSDFLNRFIEIQFIYHPVHPFEGYNSVTLSLFTV